MKVKFNGILETRNGGCIPCGQKKSSRQVVATSKMYILPSGQTKTFHVGRVEEVSDKDGEFLMEYLYTDKDGNMQSVFTKVE